MLINKIKKKFGDRLIVSNDSKKGGNFLYPKDLTFHEAKERLNNSTQQNEAVRYAAMALRSEILNMSKTKWPTPTSVDTVKENAPHIPPLTKLFYETLFNGIGSDEDISDTVQRKVTSMASDAVFATTRGAVRPWKNTVLGLGLSSTRALN